MAIRLSGERAGHSPPPAKASGAFPGIQPDKCATLVPVAITVITPRPAPPIRRGPTGLVMGSISSIGQRAGLSIRRLPVQIWYGAPKEQAATHPRKADPTAVQPL